MARPSFYKDENGRRCSRCKEYKHWIEFRDTKISYCQPCLTIKNRESEAIRRRKKNFKKDNSPASWLNGNDYIFMM